MSAQTLEQFGEMAAQGQGLVVVATSRADGTIQTSLVNAGVMAHPLTDGHVAAFVAAGRIKLANLRARPQITLTAHVGWNWVGLEGHAELIGPDDHVSGVDSERLRLLLREVFTAAGGTHDDWAEYDRVMAAERRTAVFIDPTRIYSN